jgi:hypothetical protein
VRAELQRGSEQEEGRETGVPKERSTGKKSIDKYEPPDRRLTEGGWWRRKLPPFDRARVLKVGVAGKTEFKGEMVVRLKMQSGETLNYLEDDFLLLFEPIISAVEG